MTAVFDNAFARGHPSKEFICSDNIDGNYEAERTITSAQCDLYVGMFLKAERVLCHLPPTLQSRRNTVFQPQYLESLFYLSASSVARLWLKVFLRMCFRYLLCLVTKRGLSSNWHIYAIVTEGVDRGGRRTSAI